MLRRKHSTLGCNESRSWFLPLTGMFYTLVTHGTAHILSKPAGQETRKECFASCFPAYSGQRCHALMALLLGECRANGFVPLAPCRRRISLFFPFNHVSRLYRHISAAARSLPTSLIGYIYMSVGVGVFRPVIRQRGSTSSTLQVDVPYMYTFHCGTNPLPLDTGEKLVLRSRKLDPGM